jgi:glycosyltransferase involved in cell wall biosynthesis
MNIVHLMASPFVGGPERQVLGLAASLPEDRTTFLSFAERGLCRAFLDEARRQGFESVELKANFPRLLRAAREVAGHLRRLNADVLCCSGYKPDVIGWLAGRLAGVPVLAIAHGWTAATFKVRCNEWLDRRVMRWMDAIVCVSEAQAVRVRQAGVAVSRVHVIRNAVHTAPFDSPNPEYRERLHGLFAEPPRRIVVAAGRLSPEKGFDHLIEAAAQVTREDPGIGFVLFGDGPLREALARQVADRGLSKCFILAGFRADVQSFLLWADLAVLSSHTEGLPVIVLEAMAAGLPVVATAVGGTPEVVEEGATGYLVPPGDPTALAGRIRAALACEAERQAMGQRGRQRVQREFTFAAQAAAYRRLFRSCQLSALSYQPDQMAESSRQLVSVPPGVYEPRTPLPDGRGS